MFAVAPSARIDAGEKVLDFQLFARFPIEGLLPRVDSPKRTAADNRAGEKVPKADEGALSQSPGRAISAPWALAPFADRRLS